MKDLPFLPSFYVVGNEYCQWVDQITAASAALVDMTPGWELFSRYVVTVDPAELEFLLEPVDL